eukprot:2364585-Pyramimonas_sp.AAC.2
MKGCRPTGTLTFEICSWACLRVQGCRVLPQVAKEVHSLGLGSGTAPVARELRCPGRRARSSATASSGRGGELRRGTRMCGVKELRAASDGLPEATDVGKVGPAASA